VSPLYEAVMYLVRDQDARDRDFTVRQIAILLLLHKQGQGTVRGLAAGMKIPKPSVTRSANALEASQLIRRKPDPADRRSVLLVLRPDGRRFVERLLSATATAPEEALSNAA
jgi:DNA-binding MarR family transcriptional regulator